MDGAGLVVVWEVLLEAEEGRLKRGRSGVKRSSMGEGGVGVGPGELGSVEEEIVEKSIRGVSWVVAGRR